MKMITITYTDISKVLKGISYIANSLGRISISVEFSKGRLYKGKKESLGGL